MSSTPNSVTHRSEKPENQPYYEHNDADCPHNRNPCDEANDEKNQTEKNHNASFANTYFSYCRPPRVRRFKRDEDERAGLKLLATRSVLTRYLFSSCTELERPLESVTWRSIE